MKFTAGQIAQLLEGEIQGDANTEVTSLSAIETARPGDISFLSNLKYEHHLYKTDASAVIVKKGFQPRASVHATLIFASDPYLAFTTLLEEYQRLTSLVKAGREAPVHIGQNSTYGEEVYLGAFAYIGDHVTLGKHVKIYPHAYVGDHVKVGDHTIIYAGAKIYANTEIGKFCTIHSGAVLGSDGFGYAPQPDGTWKNIPQIGNVVLKDHVDIGANTTIDCGTMSSTIIHRGVKIDNLVQVAHNVEIGENTVIAAQTGLSGSAKIGRNVLMGGQVGVQGHITVADKTTVGAKSGITKTVRTAGQTLGGKFAFENSSYLKSYAIFKKLPEVMDRIECLEQNLVNLRSGKL